MTAVAHMRLLLDNVPGGRSRQTFLQGPGGDRVSSAGHGVSTLLLSSARALGQRPEQQVTWAPRPVRAGAALSQPHPVPRTRGTPENVIAAGDSATQPKLVEGRGRRRLPSYAPLCLSCAILQRCVCRWSLRCGEPCAAPPACLSAHWPPAWQPGMLPQFSSSPWPVT